MPIRSQRDIYKIVEKHLRNAEEPMTCVDLMDIHEVEQEAFSEFGGDKRHATNKLSDTLGFMWRRGLLTRYPAGGDRGTLARYAYVWAYKDEDRKVDPVPPPTRSSKTGVIIQEHDNNYQKAMAAWAAIIGNTGVAVQTVNTRMSTVLEQVPLTLQEMAARQQRLEDKFNHITTATDERIVEIIKNHVPDMIESELDSYDPTECRYFNEGVANAIDSSYDMEDKVKDAVRELTFTVEVN